MMDKDFEGIERVERSKTIPGLAAWPTSESSCRIQCADKETAKRLAKLPDAHRVGVSVQGAWIRPQIPRKNEGAKTQNGQSEGFQPEGVSDLIP